MKPADWAELIRYVSLITGVGITMSAGVMIGWWIGGFLQNLFGGVGWLIAGLLLGVAGGAVAVYSTLTKIIPWE